MRTNRLIKCVAFAGILWLLTGQPLFAEITIVLQNGFVEHYKRRVTVDTQFVVDKAHKKPNPPSKDGDLHIAGRSDDVMLPIVAEIMNAKDDLEAVGKIHAVESSGHAIDMSGAWRLWCEHGGDSVQIQGEPLEPFTTTNPDHVFEIHPVTRLAGRSLLPTLKPIRGYKTKDADDAFTKYEGLRCRIVPGNDTTTLVTTMAGYNYVEFIMETNSEPLQVDDGVMVLCKVRNLAGETLVRNRRMVMVKDSEVEKQVRGQPMGTRFHVLGLPRINLSLLSWRVRAAAEGRADVLTWGLPYEVVVVGFYEIVADDDGPPSENVRAAGVSDGRFRPRPLTRSDIQKLGLGLPSALQPDSSPAPARSPRPQPRPVRTPDCPPLGDLIEEK